MSKWSFLRFGASAAADPAAGGFSAAAFEALTKKHEAVAAQVEKLTAQASADKTEITRLTAALTEAQEQRAAAEKTAAETQEKLAGLEKEMPEKIKAAAVELAAGSGIPAGQTPPAGQGAAAPESLQGKIKAASDNFAAASAILDHLGLGAKS